MSKTDETLTELATLVDDAATKASSIEMLTTSHPDLTVDEAYRVQRLSMKQRYGRSERLVGMKMGLTSRAKMEQVGIHTPIYGHLTDRMLRSDGAFFSETNYCQPRTDPEIAFILRTDLRGPVTASEAMLAVGGVCAALEVTDSRFENFQFNLPDVIADNASAAAFVLGDTVRDPRDIDISNLGVVLRLNGVVEQVGSTAAILEHPARSLAALANMLASVGEPLRAGYIVLAGGATASVPLEAGDRVLLKIDGLGTVSLGAKD